MFLEDCHHERPEGMEAWDIFEIPVVTINLSAKYQAASFTPKIVLQGLPADTVYIAAIYLPMMLSVQGKNMERSPH